MTTEQEKRALGERKELLQKKKVLFRERLKRRGTAVGGPDADAFDEADDDEADTEDRAEGMAARPPSFPRTGPAMGVRPAPPPPRPT